MTDAHPPREIAANVEVLAVTAGNIVGGTLLVAGVYWVAYLRGGRASRPGHAERAEEHGAR